MHMCVPHCGYFLTIMSNITTYMVGMATLPLYVRSTLKYLAITLTRTLNNEAKFVRKFLILTRCKTYFLSYTYTNLKHIRTFYHSSSDNHVKRMCNKIVNDVRSSASRTLTLCMDRNHTCAFPKFSKPKEKWRKTEQKLCL